MLYVVTRSIEMGRSGGIASVAGITTGTVAYVMLATPGLSSLVLASTAAFDAVKYVGSPRTLPARRAAAARARPRASRREDAAPRTRLRAYIAGRSRQPDEPEDDRFRLRVSSRSSSTRTRRDPGLQVLVLGLRFALLAFLSDSMWALAAGTVADRLRGTARIAWVQRWVGGSVLVGLGILAAVWTPSRTQ